MSLINWANSPQKHRSCPISKIMMFVSKRWVPRIIMSIYHGNNTFTTIRLSVHSINAKTLTEKLTELKHEWYIWRILTSQDPVKIEYHLSDKWKKLAEFLLPIENRARKIGEMHHGE